MKIISKGTVKKRWWHGITITCACGFQAILEADDDNNCPLYNLHKSSNDLVVINCPTCGNLIETLRPIPPTAGVSIRASTCFLCHGKGTRENINTTTGYEQCPSCHGTGYSFPAPCSSLPAPSSTL